MNHQVKVTGPASRANAAMGSMPGLLPFHGGPPLRRVAGGRILFHQGDRDIRLYEVEGGMLKLSRVTRRGRLQIVDFLVPGDIVGLSNADGCDCTAETIGPTMLRIHCWRPAGGMDRPFMQRLLAMAGRHEVAHHHQLLLLSLRHPEQRVAGFLSAMAGRQCGAEAVHDGCRIALPMARRDIAEHLAIAPETLSRTMKRLCRDGLIRVIGRHEVEICEAAALEGIVDRC